MPAILEGSFSSRASLLPPTVGGGPTRLDPGSRCRLLPGHTCFHQLEHLLFGCSTLLVFHALFSLGLLSLLSFMRAIPNLEEAYLSQRDTP